MTTEALVKLLREAREKLGNTSISTQTAENYAVMELRKKLRQAADELESARVNWDGKTIFTANESGLYKNGKKAVVKPTPPKLEKYEGIVYGDQNETAYIDWSYKTLCTLIDDYNARQAPEKERE